MSIFRKMETFVYKHLVVALQGKHTFEFVGDIYSKGEKVLDFGSGVGTNSLLFYPNDYVGVEVDTTRVSESKRAFPNYQFQAVSFISSYDDRLPFPDESFDIVFISLCLHHIDSYTCKILFQEFRRLLKRNGVIVGVEPVVTSHILSNIFMNLIDAGDFIISRNDYTKIYSSESFKVDPINVVSVFGYHLWQYTAIPSGKDISSYSFGMTTYRKMIKPFHKAVLYGKWVILFPLGYLLFQFIWSKMFPI